MGYLTDHRADLRVDPSTLLPSVRSIISTALVYNGPEPKSTQFSDPERAWISRYAWGEDYHTIIRRKLEQLAAKLLNYHPFDWRACVDTAPLLERSIARDAGLGWIGKNTCLINQNVGSWFFLGELLTDLPFDRNFPQTFPQPDRCGTCTRCIEACPTDALTPYELDARLCISYLTIEKRGDIPEALRPAIDHNTFGCDICQDVCPWNRRAAQTTEPAFGPREFAPPLERMAALTEAEFRQLFRDTPVSRAKYQGFLRNVAVAMGNARQENFREPLKRLACSADHVIAEHAQWALRQFDLS
jgi:epoxyqueuosine reductase